MPLKMRPKWVEVVSTSRAIAIAYSNLIANGRALCLVPGVQRRIRRWNLIESPFFFFSGAQRTNCVPQGKRNRNRSSQGLLSRGRKTSTNRDTHDRAESRNKERETGDDHFTNQ